MENDIGSRRECQGLLAIEVRREAQVHPQLGNITPDAALLTALPTSPMDPTDHLLLTSPQHQQAPPANPQATPTRKPDGLNADLFFSLCSPRSNTPVSSPALQWNTCSSFSCVLDRSYVDPTDLLLLTSLLLLAALFLPPVSSGTPDSPMATPAREASRLKANPCLSFCSCGPISTVSSPALQQETCFSLPFLYDPIPKGSHRSFPLTVLPSTHSIIPAFKISRHSLRTYQLSRPGKQALRIFSARKHTVTTLL